jgi:hypothetical protein
MGFFERGFGAEDWEEVGSGSQGHQQGAAGLGI